MALPNDTECPLFKWLSPQYLMIQCPGEMIIFPIISNFLELLQLDVMIFS